MTTATLTKTTIDTELATAREAIELLGSDSDAARDSFRRLFAPGVRHYGPGRELCAATALLQGQPDTFAGFSDRTVQIDDLSRSGEKIIGRVTFAGTHCGEFNGSQGAGQRRTADALIVLSFEDGRISNASSVLNWR
jgi:predicted ester cyclase